MSDNTTAAAVEAERNQRKTRRGYVVSDKMDKTVVVEVEDRVKHPLYGKVIRRTSKVKAHDEQNSAGIGDLVVIMETRPQEHRRQPAVVQPVGEAEDDPSAEGEARRDEDDREVRRELGLRDTADGAVVGRTAPQRHEGERDHPAERSDRELRPVGGPCLDLAAQHGSRHARDVARASHRRPLQLSCLRHGDRDRRGHASAPVRW